MAAENREADHPLIQKIQEEGYRFEFFQAVRLLQHLYPQSAHVGQQGPVEKECVRFHPSAELGFPASDLAAINRMTTPDGQPRFELITTFLSLLGSQSPLPVHYTESVIQDDSDESLVKEFLDVFHHRLQSLFYRAWEKYRYPIQFQSPGTDFYSKRLLALIGTPPEILPQDFRIPAVRLLTYSGFLTHMPRSSSLLEGILNDYLVDVPVEVESCAAQWIPIEPQQHNRLGSVNCRLGVDLTVGERVFDRSCTFSISIGPVGLEAFQRFLPPGDSLAEIRELIDVINSDNLDYYVNLWILQDEIPELRLSSPTARLGWTTWAGKKLDSNQNVRFLMKGWFHGRR